MDILQDYRLKEAKKMILENQYKISEIAEKVGYHDISYFIRVFQKKIWGNTEQLWKILNIVGKKITQIFGRCENVLLFCVQMY